MGSVWDIARKQVEDSFSSKKFIAILLLFVLVSVGSVYVGVDNYERSLEQYKSGHGYQPEKPTILDTFEMMFQFNMPLAAGLLALLLSYDTVSREREKGTIELLLSYPIYRDEVINGKFIANMFTVSVALLIAFTLSAGYAIYSIGLLPTMAEISRLSFIWISTIIYMAFFTSLGTLMSTLFRSSWRSLAACAFLLLLFLATPFIAGQAANHIYTYDESSGSQGQAVEHRAVASSASAGGEVRVVEKRQEQERNEEEMRERVQAKRKRFEQTVSRLSPPTSYLNFAKTMLGTNYQSESGSSPTLRESLTSSIGYLFYLISQTALMFTASYAVFMRQDL